VIPGQWLADLTDWAAARGWSVSVQGRKVYVVPVMLSKGAAATRVAELLGGPLLAAGDSLLDRSLLEAAVCAARPAHGELHATGYQLPDLFVSKHSGARAAEEILDHLGDRADLLTG
jgi:hydroxymethylpyrimidine pyrophosphatase-like HAD family hydrolase